MASLLEPAEQKPFLKDLLRWYRQHGRHDMPWRLTNDPYAILVSEFMLQQTTVTAVKPYYERFLNKFPTIRSLAEADLDEVLAFWSGLGYYARARNLRAAAVQIQERHHGNVPREASVLLQLPGIGPYTAGAISALAYNRPAAALDGNIIRVLMRVLGIEEDPRLKAVQVILRKLMLELTRNAAHDVVLSLMDLGATVCQPENPTCGSCPVHTFCQALQFNMVHLIPPKVEELDKPTVRRMFAVIVDQGKYLLGRRPEEGLFGGLWEFIGADIPSGVEPVPFLEQRVHEETGLKVKVQEALPGFQHELTHRIFVVRAYRCVLIDGKTRDGRPKSFYRQIKWLTNRGIKRSGISAMTRKIYDSIE